MESEKLNGLRISTAEALDDLDIPVLDSKDKAAAIRAAIDAGHEEAVHIVAYHNGQQVLNVWDGLADPALLKRLEACAKS